MKTLRLGFGNMCFAAVVASIVPALLFALLGFILEPDNGWGAIAAAVAFFFSLFGALFFGIPCALILNKFNSLNWLSIVAAGFVIAFALTTLLSIIFSPSGIDYSSESNGEWLVLNGVTTVAGWERHVWGASYAGILGIVVSGIFFSVLKKTK